MRGGFHCGEHWVDFMGGKNIRLASGVSEGGVRLTQGSCSISID